MGGITKYLKDRIKFLIVDSHLMELLKGSSFAIVVRILGVGTSYLFTFLIARFYGASAMGSFALVQTTLMITGIIARLGLDTASVRFVSENYSKGRNDILRKVYSTTLKIVMSTSIFISISLYFFAPFLAEDIMHKPETMSLFRITSLAVLPFALLFIHSESFRGMKKIIHYSLFRNMTAPFIASIILLGYYISGFSTNIYPLYSYLISISLLSLLAIITWNNHLKKLVKVNNKIKINIRDLLNVSLPMLLTSSMTYFLQWVGIIMLGIYLPSWEIGVYNVALKISLITGISLFAIESIAAPKFAELYSKKDMEGFTKLIHQSTRMIFLISLPIFIVILIFPSFFLSIFGQEYIYGKWVLIFLTLGQFVKSISGPVGYILQMTGKQRIFRNILFISTIINIILNINLIPMFGIIGTAISTMTCMILWNITSVIIIYKKYNIITFKFF